MDPSLTELHKACWRWDLPAVRNCLRKGTSSYVNPNQRACLEESFPDITPLMITLQALIHATLNDDANEASTASASREKLVVGVLSLLVDAGAKVAALDHRGMAALHYAASARSAAAIKFLLDKNKTLLSQAAAQGHLPYHCALERGGIAACDALLLFPPGQDAGEVLKGPMLDPRDGTPLYRVRNEGTGQSPVHLLCQNGHLTLLRHLVRKRGLSLSTPGGKWGANPLHICAANDRLACATFLLRAACPRAHLLEENLDGRIPLHVAAHYCNAEMQSLLSSHGLRKGDKVVIRGLKGKRFEGDAATIAAPLNASGRFAVLRQQQQQQQQPNKGGGGNEGAGEEAFAVKPANLFLPQPELDHSGSARDETPTYDSAVNPKSPAEMVAEKLDVPQLEAKLLELGVSPGEFKTALGKPRPRTELVELLRHNFRPTGQQFTGAPIKGEGVPGKKNSGGSGGGGGGDESGGISGDREQATAGADVYKAQVKAARRKAKEEARRNAKIHDEEYAKGFRNEKYDLNKIHQPGSALFEAQVGPEALRVEKERIEEHLQGLLSRNGPAAAMNAVGSSGFNGVCQELLRAQRELCKKCAVCGKRPGVVEGVVGGGGGGGGGATKAKEKKKEKVTLKQCAACKMVHYCCPEEQKQDWKAVHKAACLPLQQANADEEARHTLGWLVGNVDNTPFSEFESGAVKGWEDYFAVRPTILADTEDLTSKGFGLVFLPGVPKVDQLGATLMRLKSDELSYSATIANAVLRAGVNMNKGVCGGNGGNGGGTGTGGNGGKEGGGVGGKKQKGKKPAAVEVAGPRPTAPSKGSSVTHIDVVGCCNMFAESSSIEVGRVVALVIHLCALFPNRGELHVRCVGPSLPAHGVPAHVDGQRVTSKPFYCSATNAGAPCASGSKPAWASVHRAHYPRFRSELPPDEQADLVVLFNPGVLESHDSQREYSFLLKQLLAPTFFADCAPGENPAAAAALAAAAPKKNLLGPSSLGPPAPVLVTEFDPGDLDRFDYFVRANVLQFLPPPRPQVLERGENPFRSLSTRQVACAVNEVTRNNGMWELFKPAGG